MSSDVRGINKSDPTVASSKIEESLKQGTDSKNRVFKNISKFVKNINNKIKGAIEKLDEMDAQSKHCIVVAAAMGAVMAGMIIMIAGALTINPIALGVGGGLIATGIVAGIISDRYDAAKAAAQKPPTPKGVNSDEWEKKWNEQLNTEKELKSCKLEMGVINTEYLASKLTKEGYTFERAWLEEQKTFSDAKTKMLAKKEKLEGALKQHQVDILAMVTNQHEYRKIRNQLKTLNFQTVGTDHLIKK